MTAATQMERVGWCSLTWRETSSAFSAVTPRSPPHVIDGWSDRGGFAAQRSAAVGGEVHEVLEGAVVAAPLPPDRGERSHDRPVRQNHSGSHVASVEVGAGK